MDTCPLDILLHIVVFLPLRSVLVLRRTSRSLYAATHLHTLWALLFRIHVLEQHIPHPNTAPLASRSAHDLESLTLRAMALRRAWTAPRPVPRRLITFNTPTEPTARIIFLQFLPGRSNRWLISVRVTARPTTYHLQCWDVAAAQPRCVAVLRHADGPYGGVVLNSDPTSPAVLAMQSAQTEAFSIRFDAQDPECGFETEATIDGTRELHLLSGSTLVTRRTDDGGALSLWDLADLTQEKVRLLNPSLVQPNDRVQAIHLAHDYALVVRVQSIEIYSTTPRTSLLSVRGGPIAYPLAQSKFEWPIYTVVLSAQHASSSPLVPPIHILVRPRSALQRNQLCHYVLLPNPSYHTGEHPQSSGPSHPVTSEYNLPYDPRLTHTATVFSSLCLSGQSAMALGPYGTALWLDSHTERGGPYPRGQRLAGRVDWLGFGGYRGRGTTSTTATTGAGKTTVNRAISRASMVFAVRDDELWTCIAMQEEAGQIALGHLDGAITLLEY